MLCQHKLDGVQAVLFFVRDLGLLCRLLRWLRCIITALLTLLILIILLGLGGDCNSHEQDYETYFIHVKANEFNIH